MIKIKCPECKYINESNEDCYYDECEYTVDCICCENEISFNTSVTIEPYDIEIRGVEDD